MKKRILKFLDFTPKCFSSKRKPQKMSKSFLECLLLIIHLSLSSECLKRDRSQTTPRSLPAPAPAAAPGAETPADKGRSLEPEPRRQIRGQGLIFCNVDVNPSCNTNVNGSIAICYTFFDVPFFPQ